MKRFWKCAVSSALALALCLSTAVYSNAAAPRNLLEDPITEEETAEAAADETAEAKAAEAEAPAEEAAEAEAAEAEAETEEAETDGEDVIAQLMEENEEDLGDPELPFWAEDSLTTMSIKNYVESVSDEESENFVPVKDRIAIFDFDGTLYGELYPTYFDTTMFVHRVLHDPGYDAPQELKDIALEMEEGMKNRKMPDGSEEILATSIPKAYKGLTVSEYEDYIRNFMTYPADGFENMTYGEGYYLPMMSLVKYLSDHDFEVWVCSGTDRICARTLVDQGFGWWVSPSRVIGTNHTLVAAEQDGADPLKYVYKSDDDVVMGGELIAKNLKMNKVSAMVQEIGKTPILAFGNSTGDLSMAQYTVNNDKYEGRAYLLLCDDTERDYGNPKKALSLEETCYKSGFHTVSMKNDFTTIYGSDVHMVDHTDNYTWMIEQEVPADEPEDGISEEEPAAFEEVEYEDSPAWVGELEAAQDTDQVFVIAAIGGTTATVSMHEKDENGTWKEIMTTPAFIGKKGLGKEKEGDAKTPVGTFRFNYAFGICPDPGCALEYQQVTEDDYWSGDQRDGYHYNEMVSIADLPDLNTDDSEHITDYTNEYKYCLNISYNEEGTPGLGSAIFLHCLGAKKPYTGGCVAIPEEKMVTVMQNVQEDCAVVIDSLENLDPELWEKWGLN